MGINKFRRVFYVKGKVNDIINLTKVWLIDNNFKIDDELGDYYINSYTGSYFSFNNRRKRRWLEIYFISVKDNVLISIFERIAKGDLMRGNIIGDEVLKLKNFLKSKFQENIEQGLPSKFCYNCQILNEDLNIENCTQCGRSFIEVNDKKVEEVSYTEIMKRPTGLTITAILWFLGGFYSILASSFALGIDIWTIISLVRDPDLYLSLPEWFKFGLPAELTINLVSIIFCFIQIIALYGMLAGGLWSYKLILVVPIMIAISWILVAGLYMTAPIRFGIRESINWFAVVLSIIWVLIYWIYLRQPRIKEFFEYLE